MSTGAGTPPGFGDCSPKTGGKTPPKQAKEGLWDKIRKAGKLLRRFGSAVYFYANFGYNVSVKGVIP